MADALLEIRNLSKRYGALTAVSEVTFTVPRGAIVGLIGPNGSGKTTLFECLGGVLPADSGQLLHDGRLLTAREHTELLFYLPDGIVPWPAQPVSRVLDFTLGFFGGRAEQRERVIQQLELQPFLGQAMRSLSKGQRKRVLLAVGLLAPQPLLVADEPFDGLDLRQARDLVATLRAYAGERTLLLSIHQIGDAARVCDRFVLLSGGRARGEGTLADLSALAAARGRSGQNADLEEVFLALT